MKQNDEKFMREALRLAGLMKGRTSPDPMVGAVIVKGGRIVGRGSHAESGTPHAESMAIKNAEYQKTLQERNSELALHLEEIKHLREKEKRNYYQVILSLAAEMEEKDHYTAEHATEVVKLGLLTAQELGIPCFMVDEKTFADPYAIPRTIRNLVAATPVNQTRVAPTPRVSLAETILNTEILKKPSWAA